MAPRRTCLPSYVNPPPVGWGSTYCFTAVSIIVGVTPITKGCPAQMFFEWHVFCSPYHCLLISADLDIWAQGQAFRTFFVVISFSTILSKV